MRGKNPAATEQRLQLRLSCDCAATVLRLLFAFKTLEYTWDALPPILRSQGACAPRTLCTSGSCSPQTLCILRAAPQTLCTWGLRPQTLAMASLLDYNVASLNHVTPHTTHTQTLTTHHRPHSVHQKPHTIDTGPARNTHINRHAHTHTHILTLGGLHTEAHMNTLAEPSSV